MARMHIPMIALALLLATSAVARADGAQDAARQFLQQQASQLADQVSVSVRAPSATLPPCQQPHPFLPGHNQRLLGRVTVGIRCADGQVRYLQARVEAIGTYWVARRRIEAGTHVSASMLEPRQGNLARLPHGAIRQQQEAIGKVTTASLAAGSVVLDSALKQAALVHRRQAVTVQASGRGFRITRQGRALQDGALGDTVRVRMADRSVLAGVVAGKNLVATGP